MKYLILLLACPFTAQASQLNISCQLNKAASKSKIEQELKKHPEARNAHSDDGAILIADINAFSLVLKDSRLVHGQFQAEESTSSQVIEFDNNGVKGEYEIDALSPEIKVEQKNHIVIFNTTLQGWDFYEYKVKINTENGTATLSGSFDYDCGGSGSTVYAVYDCAISQ
ncbi:MAG: hypothetical protein AABZ31_07925 [Bdellovibrionota bacterium]